MPPGFVVDAAALEAAMAGATTAEAARDHALPAALVAAVEAALADPRLAGLAVAVRSSAAGEDGEAASYAGQQATYLHMRGPAQVLAALRACWAQAMGAGVAAYRDRLGAAGGEAGGSPGGGPGGPPGLAVLVQAMAMPVAAGVAFTADPLTGERDRLVVDAAWGLGEAVVAGLAQPDRVVVDRRTGAIAAYAVGAKAVEVVPAPAGGLGTVQRPVAPERRALRALPDAAIAGLLALAAAVEAALGPAQDLEFAWTGEAVVLLQARPITALPPPPPPGGWAPPPGGEAAPWERRNVAEHFPGPLSPLAETLVLPALEAALAGLAADLGLRVARPVLATVHGFAYARGGEALVGPVRAGLAYGALFARDPRRAPAHPARMDALLAARPSAQADPMALAAWAEAVAAAFGDAWAAVHRLSGGWRWSEFALRRAVGRAEVAAALLAVPPPPPASGPAPTGFDPAMPLVAPAAAATSPAGAGATGAGATGAGAGGAGAAGVGTAGAGAAGAGAAGAAARRAAAEAWVRAALGPGRRLAVAALAPWARRFAEAREPQLAALAHGWAGWREGLLALGAALADRGQLPDAEAVFWLPWPAVCALAADPAADPAAADPAAGPAAIAAARALHAERAAHAPPLALGEPPLPVTGRCIPGVPASPGRAAGRVRVVAGPADFDAFVPGEVLVTATTTPAWTPLFARAAAIVTDVGGPLSHGSIVAREFGIPAVLGTESASRRLRTGDRVTVDGDRGVVWF